MQTLLPGITTERVPTPRLTMAVLSVAGRPGQPVLFVHGNVSSSLFWQPTMLALPEGYRPLAVDRQEGDAGAMLAFTRGLVALRKATPALRLGEARVIAAPAGVLAFEPIIDECLRDGLLEKLSDNVRLTARGRLLSNEVFARFLIEETVGGQPIPAGRAG